MKNTFPIFLCTCLIISCTSKQKMLELDSQMQAAMAEKIKAEKNLADFKIQAADDFKEYDSLKAKGVVPTAIQVKHDSLFT
jgi:hypothetical protein